LLGPVVTGLQAEAAPAAAPQRVHFSLSRDGCYGICPAYRVDIYGDGRVLYEGFQYVDGIGKERYTVPQEEVNKLLRSALSKNLMNLKERYESAVSDFPSYIVTLQIDGRTRKIVDYAGGQVGMPAAVREFELEIDQLLEAAVQRRFSAQGLAQLDREGVDFDTPAGVALLQRAISARSAGTDAELLAIYDRLSPVHMRRQHASAQKAQDKLFDTAIAQGRAALVSTLLSRGALRTEGKYAKDRIDHAFYTAVDSGRPPMVERLWQLPDQAPHPSLQYADADWAPEKGSKLVPLTLLLRSDPSTPKNSNNFTIAKFLVEKGCDPNAVGAKKQTLLHIATMSGDAAFVRYVLGLGVKPTQAGPSGLPALASATNEDVALALLEGGMPPQAVHKLQGFRTDCQERKWSRVLAWLDAHPR
jgi:ankyrin repeat protein